MKAQFILHIHTHKQSPGNNTPEAQILSALSWVSSVYVCVRPCVCACVHAMPTAHWGYIHNCSRNNDRRFYWGVRGPLILYWFNRFGQKRRRNIPASQPVLLWSVSTAHSDSNTVCRFHSFPSSLFKHLFKTQRWKLGFGTSEHLNSVNSVSASAQAVENLVWIIEHLSQSTGCSMFNPLFQITLEKKTTLKTLTRKHYAHTHARFLSHAHTLQSTCTLASSVKAHKHTHTRAHTHTQN